MTFPAIQKQDSANPATRSSPGSRRDVCLIATGLTFLYLIAMAAGNRRFVWFDELFTHDIARSSSLQQLWYRLGRFDCNPPGAYLLSRISMSIFGDTPFGLRFPSMVEFYVGSMAVLLYVRRKANLAFATLAVLMLWTIAPTLYYAVEARPYALLFASFACLLLAWDTAVRSNSRRLALLGVFLSTLALALAHVFSVFTVLAFLVAETVRFRRRRKADYALWTALILPMLTMFMYFPLVRYYGGIVFSIHASFLTTRGFYEDTLGTPVVVFVLLTLLLVPNGAKGEKLPQRFQIEDIAMFGCLFLVPVLVNLLLMHREGTFYNRYCITTQAALVIILAVLLAYRSGLSRMVAYTSSLFLVAVVLKMQVIHGMHHVPKDGAFLASVYPELPLVVGDGEVFMEMNHHESRALLSRLYFMKDRQAALRYGNTNFFQDFESPDALKAAGFPLSGNVEAYSSFVGRNHQFLLLGNPTEWIFYALKPAGASIAIVDNYADRMPYSDTTLYMVTMP